MVLGKTFFVSPSDSVALLAANAAAVPWFAKGLKGVSRSMPTSAALDRVAKELGIPVFEVPTGWKYFADFMDAHITSKDAAVKVSYEPFICGEESFGAGSNHVREKDGLWVVLFWLSILAHHRKTNPTASVQSITEAHWAKYGRNVYARFDFERIMRKEEGKGAVTYRMAKLLKTHKERELAEQQEELKLGAASFTGVQGFIYDRPDFAKSPDVPNAAASGRAETSDLGVIFNWDDGSRFVIRSSGTGTEGETMRVYFEQFVPGTSESINGDKWIVLNELIALAKRVIDWQQHFDQAEPTVRT